MRTGQLQALSNTRHAQGHPFDAIDLSFGLLTAISASPIAAFLAIGQYFARRSPWVAETMLNAINLSPALEDTRLVRGVLPGVTKLLPTPTDDLPVEAELVTDTSSSAPPANRLQVLSTEQWRDALEESPHLLIYGPSKAGKSTLAQAVVAMFRGCEYVVIDPQPNKPGEQKWGGIDFITLDDHGSDEYASIKIALARIKTEDDRRRRGMRTHTPRPLVVIIDEVLALVGALGTITNDEGKREPRMAHFIRTMGYSARHRNIKIILIGQGKNLADLGLNSGTARNNYALVRAARNAATNARSAFIATDDGEQAIDVRQVLALANAAAGRARVWLTHADLTRAGTSPQPSHDDLLSTLLGTEASQQPAENGTTNHAEAGNKTARDGNSVSGPVTACSSDVSPVTSVSVTAEEAAIIAQLLAGNKAPSMVARALPGYTPREYKLYKAKVDLVAAMLNQQSPQNDPDQPDPDEDVPPAFRGAL